MARVVLVTGVSRYLGGRFARVLTAQPGIDRVIGVDVGVLEVFVHRLLGHPERAADPYRGQLAAVHEPVHGHLRHAHHRRDLRHRQEADVLELTCHATPPYRSPTEPAAPSPVASVRQRSSP